MILKRQSYDDKHRLETRWVPNVESAEVVWSDEWESEVLRIHIACENPNPCDELELIVLDRGEGVYLCNDEGKTVEVISRLQHPDR